jgi:uncharacterized SAM-binding protein YcdF (DUF218 family)
VLKTALLTLVMPPVCFLYLTLSGHLVARRRRRIGSLLVWVGLAGLTVLSLPAVGTLMIAGLESDLPLTPPPDAMPGAIVILGGDLARVSDPPFVRAGRLTLDRLRAGAAAHRRTGLPILVTGGIVQRDRPAVATIMADSLREDFQAPATWVEDVSADTWDNAALSAVILKQHGIRSVYVVTQGWHMRRAVLAFRRAGLIATAMPTSLDPPIDLIASDFIPQPSSWEWSYYALHEWIGYAWYAIH